MSFLESPRFPLRISANMPGGPEYSTEVTVLASGEESRNANWSQARLTFEASIAVRTLADFAEVEGLFRAVRGRHVGFRFRDWGDYEFGASGRLRPLLAGVPVGTLGAGFGVATYRLTKLYEAGALSHEREIRKPAPGAFTVTRNSVAVAVGVAPGQVALDTTAGLVTFVADQTRAVSTHTPGAAHQVVLASAFAPNLVVGGRLWLAGVTGTAAAALNDRSHAVTGVSGATVTLGTGTAGLTASGGAASFFPQPADTLHVTGEFDVPVRFDTDRLQRTVIGRNSAGQIAVECESIPLIEVRR